MSSDEAGLGALDQDAVLEQGPGADQRDQVSTGDRASAGLGGLDQLEYHRKGPRMPAPRVTLVHSCTVEDIDSRGFVFRRWIQCSAGNS